MEQGLVKTGRAAENPRADEESGTELESDGALDSPTGSALGSCRKRPNPWNLVFEKFGSGKTDDAIIALREHSVLDLPFIFSFVEQRMIACSIPPAIVIVNFSKVQIKYAQQGCGPGTRKPVAAFLEK